MIKWMIKSQISLVSSIQKQGNSCLFSTTQEESEQRKAVQHQWQPQSKRRAGDAQSDKESPPGLFSFNCTPPYIYHSPPLALLSNPKVSSSYSNNLSSLRITTGEQRDRKVLQDKWRGSNFWGLSFKRGGEEGCVHREWSTDFHLGAPLGQYFAKPGVCNLLIKVLTLGQLTRLISPRRHVPWPQGKLKHIREYFRQEIESFC